MAGTDITYGGISLRNCWTKEFSQQHVMDHSGTDVLYDEFMVRVECIANAALLLQANPSLGIHLAGAGGINVQELMRTIHRRLSQDRLDFAFFLDGNLLLGCDSTLRNNTISDVNNGPHVAEI